MPLTGHRLGIDFGTSTTVAVLSWPDGRIKPLLFDGTPLLPSAVYAGSPAGTPVQLLVGSDAVQLLVGSDAVHAASVEPERYEPHPKRRIDEGSLLLGDAEVSLVDCVTAVLRRIAAEARRVAGGEVDGTVVTCPAGWGPRRRRIVAAAARAAGLPDVRMTPEPVAAAAYFVDVVKGAVPDGAPIVVYDFGAGTFDATVVRRRAGGFDVLATRGLDDAGGLDIDAAIVSHFGMVYGGVRADLWRRLTMPETATDRRAARQVWDGVRGAKESLSRLSTTVVHLPLFDVDAPLGREQLDQLALSTVNRTVEATRAALRDAGVDLAEVAAVFLVGGSSRLPLAATALHRGLGIAPTVIEQPELVVAEGSLCVPRDETADELAAPPATTPAPRRPSPTSPHPAAGPASAAAPVPTIEPEPVRPGPSWTRARAALLVVAMLTLGAGLWVWIDPPRRWSQASPASSGSASSGSASSGSASSGSGSSGSGSATPASPTPGGSSPAATASPTAGTSAPSSPGAVVPAGNLPPCTDSDLSLVAIPEQVQQFRGAYLTFIVTVQNVSTRDCSRDLGADFQELYLQVGAAKMWSSDACGASRGSKPTTLTPSVEVSSSVVWNGKATLNGCANRETPPAGRYQLIARLDTKLSAPAAVQLT